MGRYIGSIYRKSRKLGYSVLENNSEFLKNKKRTTPPGQHGANRSKPLSNYGIQLYEKQKIKFTYGLREKQLLSVYRKAKKMGGILGTTLIILLERRIDNIVYRLNFAPTRSAARQLVTHGHILVNGKKVDIASALVYPNDVIELKPKSKTLKSVVESMGKKETTLEFVKLDKNNVSGVLLRDPQRTEVCSEIQEHLIVEWFSRLS